MSRWLAMDTATAAVTVAVCDESGPLAGSSTIDARRHAEILAPGIDEVMRASGTARSDLAAVAVGVGPGPFTGLRAGIVTAATLGYVLGIPAYGVCSLDAIAAEVAARRPELERFVVATDARRREVYWAAYAVRGQDVEREGEPAVGRAADLPSDVRALPAAGRGATLYPDDLPRPLDVLDVDAAHVAAVARRRPDLRRPLQPLYLRQPDAVPPAAPKSVLGR